MNANTILGGIAVVTSLVAVAGLVGWALVEGFKALRTRRGRGWHDQHGATTVEYALMMAVVVVAVAASLVSLQASVGEGVRDQTEAIGGLPSGSGPEATRYWQ